MDPSEPGPALLGPLGRGWFRVKGQHPQCGQEKLGQVFVAQDGCLPEAIATLHDGLEHQLNSPGGNLPAHKEAQERADLQLLGGNSETLDLEDGIELNEEIDNDRLISRLVAIGEV